MLAGASAVRSGCSTSELTCEGDSCSAGRQDLRDGLRRRSLASRVASWCSHLAICGRYPERYKKEQRPSAPVGFPAGRRRNSQHPGGSPGEPALQSSAQQANAHAHPVGSAGKTDIPHGRHRRPRHTSHTVARAFAHRQEGNNSGGQTKHKSHPRRRLHGHTRGQARRNVARSAHKGRHPTAPGFGQPSRGREERPFLSFFHPERRHSNSAYSARSGSEPERSLSLDSAHCGNLGRDPTRKGPSSSPMDQTQEPAVGRQTTGNEDPETPSPRTAAPDAISRVTDDHQGSATQGVLDRSNSLLDPLLSTPQTGALPPGEIGPAMLGNGNLSQYGGLKGKAVGVMIGATVGDVLGSAVEGWTKGDIAALTQGDGVRDFRPSKRGFGTYTDDTQMMLGLGYSLVSLGHLDASHCSQKYAELFDRKRGYGASASKVIQLLKDGGDYQVTGRVYFPEGSYANGGAMRIAPVGIAFRNASNDVLHAATEAALLCTHVHPEAIDAAFIQAAAISLCLNDKQTADDRPALSSRQLIQKLASLARTEEMRTRLLVIDNAMQASMSEMEVLPHISEPFQIRAVDAVACVLLAVCYHFDEPEECIVRSVSYGGDTDTIACMAGAIMGARHGCAWIPSRWWDNLETGEHGKYHILSTALLLSELDLRECEPVDPYM
mmetsp:Transcript_6493/g.24137  ORF Transcript_6493/g.24137 Transcript_6493/m.24137 type:complete len:664 (-) Transcript_6493:21-2012(-)